MKKQHWICYIISAMLLMQGMGVAAAAQDVQFPYTTLAEDFEDETFYPAGVLYSGASTQDTANGKLQMKGKNGNQYVVEEESGNRIFKLSIKETGSSLVPLVQTTLGYSFEEKKIVEFRIKASESGNFRNVTLSSSKQVELVDFGKLNDGTSNVLKVLGNDWASMQTVEDSYKTDGWYGFRFAITAARAADERIRFVADVCVTYEDEPIFKQEGVAFVGDKAIDPASMKVRFQLQNTSQKQCSLAIDDLKIYTEGTVVVDSPVYKCNETPVDSPVAGMVSVSAQVSSKRAMDATGFFGLYKKDGNALVAMDARPVSLTTTPQTVTASVQIPQDADNYYTRFFLWSDADMTCLTPVYTLGQSQAPSLGAVEGITASIDRENLKITGQTESKTADMGVAMILVYPEFTESTLEELDEYDATKMLYLTQGMTGADGKFCFDYVFPDTVLGGTFGAWVKPFGQEAQKLTIEYISENDREIMFNMINQTADENALVSMLATEANRTMLENMGVDFTDYLMLSPDRQTLACKQLKTVTYTGENAVEDFAQQLQLACALQFFNEADSDALLADDGVLERYEELISLDMGEESDFAALGEDEQEKILESLAEKEFESLDEIETFFEKETALSVLDSVSDYQRLHAVIEKVAAKGWADFKLGSYNNLGSYRQTMVLAEIMNSSITSFEQAASIFNEQLQTRTQVRKPASGGGGGGGTSVSRVENTLAPMPTVVPVQPPQSTQQPESVAVTYDDLGTVPWAEEMILALSEKGILQGTEPGRFSPNDPLTREQFVKMLIVAFELLDEDAVCDFSDVQQGQWYYPYVASARKIGLTQGMGNGSFGVGTEISRQEMAVMATRILDIDGVEIEDKAEEVTYTDEEDIASYALESVKKLQRAGIINGVDENRFAPYETATRAQAAKILYGLLE